MANPKLFFNWSSGKDSALALHSLMEEALFSPELLVSTLSMPQRRISLHGVREELIQMQAVNMGLPVQWIPLPDTAGMDEYSQIMRAHLSGLKQEGFTHGAFGDILLEDVKEFRQKQLEEAGLNAVFPLWGMNTKKVAEEFIAKGFKAIVVSVHAGLLDESFCGRLYDSRFLNDLPSDVDPCGENGEFHTFCFDGPLFKQPVHVYASHKVYREYPAPSASGEKPGFWFCELKEGSQ